MRCTVRVLAQDEDISPQSIAVVSAERRRPRTRLCRCPDFPVLEYSTVRRMYTPHSSCCPVEAHFSSHDDDGDADSACFTCFQRAAFRIYSFEGYVYNAPHSGRIHVVRLQLPCKLTSTACTVVMLSDSMQFCAVPPAPPSGAWSSAAQLQCCCE